MSLRATVMRGGAYLVARQAIGMVTGFLATLYVIRRIGPAAFGLFAASVGIYQYFTLLGQWGLNTYLIRQEKEVDEIQYDQAFSLLLVNGIALAVLGILVAAPWEMHAHLAGLAQVARVVFLMLPVELVALIPLARLERALAYKQVAKVEFVAATASQLVMVGLALAGAGLWSLVIAGWLACLIRMVGFFRLSRCRLRWRWDWHQVRQMFAYGLSFSLSGWIWQIRVLVNPLVVGRFLGAAAVGQVALAIRFVETLGFMKTATWRLSLAAFARLQNDRQKLLGAISEGMRLQVMAVGTFLGVFAIAGPPCLGWLLGKNWDATFEVFPFIALGMLTNTVFSLHSSALYALRRNWEMTAFTAFHVVIFVAAIMTLVPRVGVTGYGWAELVAFSSYVLLHVSVARSLGAPSYRTTLWWYLALAGCLFTRQLGWWAYSGLVALMLRKSTWAEIAGIWSAFRRPAMTIPSEAKGPVLDS